MTSEATDEPEANAPDPGEVGSSADAESGQIEIASKTDVGQVRSANEDSCDTFERTDGARLLIVADGMGGHQGGATASRTAVATIASLFLSEASDDNAQMIRDAIEAANRRVFELAQSDPGLEGMGTTVVSFILDSHGQGVVAHVGDSRAYRYRKGQLEPLTIDHSVVAEMHRRGLISADEAAVHPRRNEILRSVGHGAEVEVEVAEVEVAPGDRFVLCSDGLTGVLQDHEIAAVIQAEAAEPAVEQLIQMANERGGPDNISVQVLSIPASRRDGDPEATAPVELSEVGIQAIEAKRSERKRMRSMTIVAIGLGLCFGIYLAWRAWGPSPQGPAHNPSIEPSFESPAPSTDARARDLDQLESRVDLIEGEGAALAPSLEEPVAEDATRVQPDDSIAHRNGTDYDTKDTEDTKHTEAPAPATRSAEDSFGDEPVPARRGIPR